MPLISDPKPWHLFRFKVGKGPTEQRSLGSSVMWDHMPQNDSLPTMPSGRRRNVGKWWITMFSSASQSNENGQRNGQAIEMNNRRARINSVSRLPVMVVTVSIFNFILVMRHVLKFTCSVRNHSSFSIRKPAMLSCTVMAKMTAMMVVISINKLWFNPSLIAKWYWVPEWASLHGGKLEKLGIQPNVDFAFQSVPQALGNCQRTNCKPKQGGRLWALSSTINVLAATPAWWCARIMPSIPMRISPISSIFIPKRCDECSALTIPQCASICPVEEAILDSRKIRWINRQFDARNHI